MPAILAALAAPTPAIPLALTIGLALRGLKAGKDRPHGIRHIIHHAMLRHRPEVMRDRLANGAGVHVGATTSLIQTANAVILAHAPSWSMGERHMALAIGNLETGFGVSGSWLLDDGTPSYNWGGLMGSGTNGYLTHGDFNADGTPIIPTPHFKAFNTMGEAFDAFKATWTRGDSYVAHPDIAHEPNVDAAAARGDALNVARTMYAHGYFEGTKGSDEDRIQLYATAIVNNAKEIADQLGEPVSVSMGGTLGGNGVPWWGWPLVAILTAGVFYRVLR